MPTSWRPTNPGAEMDDPMPTLDTLTQNDLKAIIPAGNLKKARSYQNAVSKMMRSGESLRAQVRGSFLYDVEIVMHDGKTLAVCSCPYMWGDFCKHIGAVLEKWLNAPELFQPLPVDEGGLFAPIPVDPQPSSRPPQLPGWVGLDFGQRQAQIHNLLSASLDVHKLQDLRQMARNRGWTLRGTRKMEVIDQIIQQMQSPGEMAKAVYSQDAEHQNVLRALLFFTDSRQSYPASADVERMAKALGSLGRHVKIETYTSHLMDAGLAVNTNAAYSPNSLFQFVPPALARLLPPLLETVFPGSRDLAIDTSPNSLHLAEPARPLAIVVQLLLLFEQIETPLSPPPPQLRVHRFVRNLDQWGSDVDELARLWAQDAFAPGSSPDLFITVPPPVWPLPKEETERLAAVAGGPDQLDFYLHLMRAVGLLQPGSPVTVWPEVKEDFLRQNDVARWSTLCQTYFQLISWNEIWFLLRRNPDLTLTRNWNRSYFHPDHLLAELSEMRRVILRILVSLPDGRWINLTDLQPLIMAAIPALHQSAAERRTYAGILTQPAWQVMKKDSTSTVMPYVQAMIDGPLRWLGLVDICEVEGVPVAVRFHHLADHFWDRIQLQGLTRTPVVAEEQVGAEPHAHAIQIGPEGRIVVDPGRAGTQVHSMLDHICRLEDATATQFVYVLDAAAVHQSFEAGETLAELQDQWTAAVGAAMPQPVTEQLGQWWQAYGHTHLYTGVTIIEFDDDFALAEMKAATSLESVLVAEISPRLVIIPESAVTTLVAELEKAGYTPKKERE